MSVMNRLMEETLPIRYQKVDYLVIWLRITSQTQRRHRIKIKFLFIDSSSKVIASEHQVER